MGFARPGPPVVAVRLVDDVDRLEGAGRRRHCGVEEEDVRAHAPRAVDAGGRQLRQVE